MSAIGPIEALMLLAVAVVVPLGLSLAAAGDRATAALRLARLLLPVGAIAVAASFLLDHRGNAAAALVLPWLGITLLVAAHGLARLLRDAGRWPEMALAAGCALLPIGGGWLVMSRLGASSFGFEEPIPLLTAIHFHYAVFATLALVGLAGRRVGDGAVFRAIVAGAVAGPLLLAAGITFSPALEIAAAVLVVATVSTFAVLTLARVVPRLRGLPRALLAASAASVLLGMAAALAYAVGEFTGRPLISLGQMARIHGPLNGLGFALCGLLGWTLEARNSRPPSL